MAEQDEVERVARAICQTGKWETGEGTCAARCMDQLGFARKKCPHVSVIFGDLARTVIAAYDSPLREALEELLKALAMGPLEVAAEYGPDAHPDEPVTDAARKAQAALSATKGKDNG